MLTLGVGFFSYSISMNQPGVIMHIRSAAVLLVLPVLLFAGCSASSNLTVDADTISKQATGWNVIPH